MGFSSSRLQDVFLNDSQARIIVSETIVETRRSLKMAKLQGTRLGAFHAYFFGFFVCTAGFLFGYDTGIVGKIRFDTSMRR